MWTISASGPKLLGNYTCVHSAGRGLRAALAVVALATAACGDGGGPAGDGGPAMGSLLVSWSFVDGRTCAETGVLTVRIRVGQPDGSSATIIYGCLTGFERAVASPIVPIGVYDVLVEGRDANGVTLYRAEAEASIETPDGGIETVVPLVLAFTG